MGNSDFRGCKAESSWGKNKYSEPSARISKHTDADSEKGSFETVKRKHQVELQLAVSWHVMLVKEVLGLTLLHFIFRLPAASS